MLEAYIINHCIKNYGLKKVVSAMIQFHLPTWVPHKETKKQTQACSVFQPMKSMHRVRTLKTRELCFPRTRSAEKLSEKNTLLFLNGSEPGIFWFFI
jgi:hypothetical protein